MGHLISAELDDWMPRIRRILDDGPAKAFDPFDRFAHVDRDVDATLNNLVERFAAQRSTNLAELDELVTEADLDRRGLAGSQDAAVGPWKAYLGILLRREDPAAVPD